MRRLLVPALIAALGASAPAAAHEISVRVGPLDVRGAEYERWYGGDPLVALSIQGGISPASFVTLTGGWTLAGLRRDALGDRPSSVYADGAESYGLGSIEMGLDLHRIALGAKLQRPVGGPLWPFVEVQGLLDLAGASFDAREDDLDEWNLTREVAASPGVFVGGGIELVGGPTPAYDRRHDVRRPAIGWIARAGYAFVAPYSWGTYGEIPSGGFEFSNGLVIHF